MLYLLKYKIRKLRMYCMGISMKKLRREVILCSGKYNTFCTFVGGSVCSMQYILWVYFEHKNGLNVASL
jgi:hypothetical protein